MTSTQHNHHLYLSNSNSKIPVPVNRNLHINSFKNDLILSNSKLIQYDTGTFTKNHLRSNKQISFQSYSLQSSPSNNSIYNNTLSGRQQPHSTNCTPQHFYKNYLQNHKYRDFKNDSNLDDDLSISSENNNSSNDDLDSNFSSDNSELNNCNKDNLNNYFNRQKCNINSNFNITTIKHSNSLNNNLSDNITKLPKINSSNPTSLSLSGNNLLSLNQNVSYSPNSGVKYEAFIMTGEVMLNLATSNSKDNYFIFGSKSVNDLKMEYKNKRTYNKSNSNCSDLMRQCLTDKTNLSVDTNEKIQESTNLNNDKNCLLDENLKKKILIKNQDDKDEDKFVNDKTQDKNHKEEEDENKNNNVKNSINSNSLVNEKNLFLNEEEKNFSTLNNVNLINDFEKNYSSPNIEEDLSKFEEENDKMNLIISDIIEKEKKDNLSKINSNEIVDETTINKRYPSFITSELNENLVLRDYHYTHTNRTVDMASAKRLAKRLYNLDKFKKSDVSLHLCKNNDFTKAVTKEYLSYFDFTNQTLLEALRSFLDKFSLIGETQERERILVNFSKRYFECNPSSFKSSDVVHTLTCAIMLLNSDLHGEGVSCKMTVKKFMNNLNNLNDGENFSNDFLQFIYTQIKNNKLEWSVDDEKKQEKNIQSNLINNPVDNPTLSNVIFDIPYSLNSSEYRKGYLLRKCCCENNGKKTPFGKRGWKLFYATLRDMVLYLHKNDQGFEKSQIYSSLKNSIKIHNSLASIASDYDKREFVFRLRTADGSVYLFCLSNKQELDSWMDTINFVAGCFSAPPLPAAVGSQTLKKLTNKSILPANLTNLSFNEQLADHVMRKVKLKQKIQLLNSKIKSDNLSKKTLKEYNFQINSLTNELKRYNTYIMIMNKVKPFNYTNKIFEKTSNFNSFKTKSLTTTVIGEEQIENENEEKCINEKPSNFTDKLNKITEVIKKKN